MLNTKNQDQRGRPLTGTFTNSLKVDREYFVNAVVETLTGTTLIRTGKKIEYINVPAAFDIETTSFEQDDRKYATMYVWQFGINGVITFGRTWDEFLQTIDELCCALELSKDRRLIVYVHNLAFEFQFIRRLIEWEKVFAVNDRKPVYALSKCGIEFRCSYILSGYGLASLGDKLRKYPVAKMVGDLDYNKTRHSGTPLTWKEWRYCENDVRVVMAYIQERIEADGDITKIPLTKTGYVRTYCRNCCMYEGAHRNNVFKFLTYRTLMNELTVTEDEYNALKRAFQGGFTHANAFYSGKVVQNVGSYDFTSSYPSVIVAEMFPMSKAQIIQPKTKQEFERNLILYCCLFDVEFIGLEAVVPFENPISASRCFVLEGATENNGRVVEADRARMTITEQDYFVFRKFYTWKSMKIGTFRRYKKGYLPTNFVKSVLSLYTDKTTLKGVEGREEDYLRSKEMINSCYGMMVTDIARDENNYDGEKWVHTPADVTKSIDNYNNSVRRFLFFPWGVWVTAYARRNLFSGIYEFGDDYVYSDTDSVKAINIDRHREYIDAYNKHVTEKLERACAYHHIDPAAIRPKTIKGEEKPLGVWDFEGVYARFKTLGAKRYMVEKHDALVIDRGKKTERHFNISLTVSGINKEHAIPFLMWKYKGRIFDRFTEDLYIPPKYTGKMTHTYIDDPFTVELTDYKGVRRVVSELSCVHLAPAEYSLSLSDAYIDYLKGIREYEK